MTTRANTARHRAEVTKTNSLAVIAKAVGDNAGTHGPPGCSHRCRFRPGPDQRYRSQRCRDQRSARIHLRFRPGSPVRLLRQRSRLPPPLPSPTRSRPFPLRRLPSSRPPSRLSRSRTPRPAPPALPAAGRRRGAPQRTGLSVASGNGATIAAAAYAQIGVVAGLHRAWPPTPWPPQASTSTAGRPVTCPSAAPWAPAKPARATSRTTRTAARAWPTSPFTSATAWPSTAAGTAGPPPCQSVNVGSGPVFIRVGG